MSDYARNLDTYNDFDEPEYMPEVGDRVKIDPQSLPQTNAESYLGVVETVVQDEDGEFEFSVRMDERRPGTIGWYVYAALDDLELYA